MERRGYNDDSGNDRGRDRGRDSGRDSRDDRGSSRERDRGDDRGRDSSRDRGDDRGGRGRDRGDDRGRDSSRGSSRGGFEYQRRDPEHLRERAQENSKFDSYLNPKIKTWKPNDGDNAIRIIPPTWEAPKHYGLDIWVHYGVGADRQTYLCPEKMGKGKCPVCEERRNFGRDADLDNERDKDYMRELDAKRRTLVYLVDRDHERDGVQAYAMPSGTDDDIVKVTKDKRTGEVLAIDHPEDGYDVTFERTGQGKKTKYGGVAIARSSSALGRSEWLEFAQDNPLPDQLIYYDYDHIAREFGGGGGPKDSNDSDDRGGRDRGDNGRDSGRDRGRDSRDDRGSSSRGGDDRGSSRGRNEEPELSWASIHGMTGRELEDLIESKELKIDARKAKDDEDLADWVCEEMGLKKEEERRRADTSDDRGRDSGRDRGGDDRGSENRLRDLRDRLDR